MQSRWTGGARLCLVALFGLLIGGCGEEEPYRLGFIGNLSGRSADLGEAGRSGAILAVEEANAAGGLHHRKIELVIEDDGGSAETTVPAIERLAAAGVEAAIGPMLSSVALATLPIAEQKGMVLISPSATASSLTGKDDNLFKVVSSTREHTQGSAAYQYAQGFRRAAVVYDLGNAAYTEDWLKDYRTAFEALGGQVVAEASFRSGDDAGYGPAIASIAEASPDIVQFVANAVDTVRLTQITRANGLSQQLAAATWAATENLLELGGRTVEGMILTQFFDRGSDSPRFRAFRDAYLQRFKQEPGFASVAAYDATHATLFALEHKGDEGIKQALLTAGSFDGLQETWSFDQFGDARRPARVAVVKDGKFLPIQP